MLTTSSLAIRPVTVATAACQVPKPSGANMTASAEPAIASRDELLSSTMPKAPFSKPKPCRNQSMTVEASMTVPARFMKDQPRSQVERRTFPAEGT